jgi:hypothetical protein
MAQLAATVRELKTSFRKHFHVYNKIDPTFNPMTRRLLLFYSVESGLKCFLLMKIRKNNTNDFQQHHEYSYLREHGHDIKKLIKFSGISGSADYNLTHFTDIHGNQIEPEYLHQIWRYGIKTDKEQNEAEAERVLKNIALWLNTVII